MSHRSDRVDPARLCDAAEAVLNAMVEYDEFFGEGWVHPLSLVGTDHEPASLSGFTRGEIEQACDLLSPFHVFDGVKCRRDAA